MAGEQGNKAAMARAKALEMLTVFGWKKVGPEEQNWACVTQEHLNERDKEKKAHSTDIVFSYDDPYEARRIYLNTDLKSYAAGTIQKSRLKKELINLAQATECANKSEEWQNLYQSETHNSTVHGLLFIYNHDAKYDESFVDILDTIRASSIKLRKPYKLVVFGPKLIWYLYCVSSDILKTCTQMGLNFDECGFYYPELVRARTRLDQAHAATIEMVTGPWQIFRYPSSHKGNESGGYLFYYHGTGETIDEFKYIIDYIFRYQLLREKGTVQIRLINPSSDAASKFDKARNSYAEDFYGFEDFGKKEFQQRIERISYKSVTGVESHYSEIELGM